jgi:hypothetical protein
MADSLTPQRRHWSGVSSIRLDNRQQETTDLGDDIRLDLGSSAMNRRTCFMLQFVVGLAIAIAAALMMFCQERCFLGLDLEFWPIVLGIFGMGLIATSGVRPLHA